MCPNETSDKGLLPFHVTSVLQHMNVLWVYHQRLLIKHSLYSFYKTLYYMSTRVRSYKYHSA